MWDIFDGKSNAEIGKTDEEKPNGLSIAEEIGLAMAAEAPDLSREEAEKLLEELLQLGQELEKALVVKVTSESNPRTGR